MTYTNPVPHLVNVKSLSAGTDARVVTVLGVQILFSFEAPVGFKARLGGTVILEGKHTKTTRRHIKEWITNYLDTPDYLEADESQFPGLLRSELTKALKETPSRLDAPKAPPTSPED